VFSLNINICMCYNFGHFIWFRFLLIITQYLISGPGFLRSKKIQKITSGKKSFWKRFQANFNFLLKKIFKKSRLVQSLYYKPSCAAGGSPKIMLQSIPSNSRLGRKLFLSNSRSKIFKNGPFIREFSKK